MRFMSIVKSAEGAAGAPPKALFDAMGKLAEEAAKAGCVMVETGGLLPSSTGARIRLSQGKLSVIDGPFTEAKEVVGGFAIFDAKSKAEAIEWIKRCPNPHNEDSEIEIRQIFELEDFGASEAVEHHRKLSEQIGKK